MIETTEVLVPEVLRAVLRGCDFFMLRMEAEFTPCAGIAAVAKQECAHFARRGVLIAPWCARMSTARAALERGTVVDLGCSFQIKTPGFRGLPIRVLLALHPERAAIVYLAAENCFLGGSDPYDTPHAKHDALVLGVAVSELLQAVAASPRAFAWGADWQTVPALVRLAPTRLTVLTVHNAIDSWFGDVNGVEDPGYAAFCGPRTALGVGLDLADVVTAVNRGFAWSLGHEPIYTGILADHLQSRVGRIVGIDNGNFTPVSAAVARLEVELTAEPAGAGLRALQQYQQGARAALPKEISRRAAGKVLFGTMGRRAAQKQPDVVVEAIRTVLRRDATTPLFIAFATVSGAEPESQLRQERILRLAEEFPEHVSATEGRLDYYPALMSALDFTVLASLYEPHGSCFEGGPGVPIVRAIDGLACQVCAFEPHGRAAALNALWHGQESEPNGLTFREPSSASEFPDLAGLLRDAPSPGNATFRAMVEALAGTIEQAVSMRQGRPDLYAHLVRGAIRTQLTRSWEMNLGGLLALVEQARRRSFAAHSR